MISRRVFALAALACGAAGAAFAQAVAPGAPGDPRPRAYRMLGQAAPAFDFPLLGGARARLADYRGRTLILYVGGLWCPDCVLDGPHTNELARLAAGDRRIAFLQIHTQNRFGRWGSVPAYFAEYNYSWPVAFDETRTWMHENYAVDWSPSFLIIDRHGIIRAWRTDLGADGAHDFFVQAQAIASRRR